MAERRMFAKTIIDSDAFLDMPMSSQCLYFHLSMRADDDGFINSPKKVQRITGASDDDLKLLIVKKFIIPFDSGIVVIKHWKIHNYIRNDRKKETMYPDEMSLLDTKENGAYRLLSEVPMVESKDYSCDETSCAVTCQSVDSHMSDTCQSDVGIGKDRLGKDRLGKDRVDYNGIKDAYNSLCPSLPSIKSLSEARKKAIKARLNSYSLEDLHEAFRMAEESDFLKGSNDRNWTANFDWIMKDANIAKILDGNYQNRSGSHTKQNAANMLDESYRMMAEWGES